MRQVSFTYGVHGVPLWLIAADVGHYRRLVILTAIGYLLDGPMFFVVDLNNGMPWSWTAGNGGSCLIIGALLLGLLWGEQAAKKDVATIAQVQKESSVVDDWHGRTSRQTGHAIQGSLSFNALSRVRRLLTLVFDLWRRDADG